MKKVLVIGAGLSGIAISKLLAKKGYNVLVTDSKSIDRLVELEDVNIQVFENGHPDFLKDFEYEFVVKSPGIPYHNSFVQFFVRNKVKIYDEIEVASWYAHNYTYGVVTGTNGKTTTTTLLSECLKRKENLSFAAGNIGLPLSDIVYSHEGEVVDIALEIAAFQLLGVKKFHPTVSVCMNLSPDHLDYFESVDDYYNTKMLVYKNQEGDDWFLRNIDDELVMKYATDIKCKVIDFSVNKQADLWIDNGQVKLFDEVLFDVEDCKIPGTHNLINCMVAACMAYKMGVEVSDIKSVISEFKGVEHRLEFVNEIDGVKYYNDSKGTNVDATITALKAFNQPVILIAGGYDKKTGFNEVIPYLGSVKEMIVYGETKGQLKKIYPNAKSVNDLLEAVELCKSIAKNDDIVLFSPMCASWDQFANYEQRGRKFKDYVNFVK